VGGVSKKAHRTDEHGNRNSDSHDWVNDVPAGGEHDRGPKYDSHTACEVGHHMKIGAADVEVLVGVPAQAHGDQSVRQKPRGRHRKHPGDTDLGRVLQPVVGLSQEVCGNHEQGQTIGESRQHLHAMPSESVLLCDGPGGHEDGAEAQQQRDQVCQHMGCVAQERQAACPDSPADLSDENHGRQRNGECQPASQWITAYGSLVLFFRVRIHLAFACSRRRLLPTANQGSSMPPSTRTQPSSERRPCPAGSS
jgi:hypothetical protein